MSITTAEVLRELERRGSAVNVEGMARYGIRSARIFGVSVAELRRMAREIGPDHALALDLWETGWHEARMLAAFLADPKLLTPGHMNRWASDFDNWAITDTVCFSLFDRSPHAWSRVDLWSGRSAEFVRRAAFALMASLALHDARGSDVEYRSRLPLIRKFASDPRDLVRKAISWALHGVGCRSHALHAAALEVASDLAGSSVPAERWVGRDALRKLTSAATAKRLNRKSAAPPLRRRRRPGDAS